MQSNKYQQFKILKVIATVNATTFPKGYHRSTDILNEILMHLTEGWFSCLNQLWIANFFLKAFYSSSSASFPQEFHWFRQNNSTVVFFAVIFLRTRLAKYGKSSDVFCARIFGRMTFCDSVSSFCLGSFLSIPSTPTIPILSKWKIRPQTSFAYNGYTLPCLFFHECLFFRACRDELFKVWHVFSNMKYEVVSNLSRKQLGFDLLN